ncbi:uncharacterized membrane-anchored protein YitT (DUF2179 family) [Sinobaca qinghaiensis]|uniref:Uncharacterized membrane-anchored protein YitT (DUF2179 family) n=1 Tax=Sinobaca qinghaiensis TaxID=342944 RepID=A0A419V8D3_9BACL|nr:YitT family protein [Sinobaca qinghaiensis]RKD76374.1 uncharacterized membrane-anchored protein YitT (DUF2179 family) [Sinobaca qinghaiensis]
MSSFVTKKQRMAEFGYVLFGSTLIALAYNIFLLPSRLAAGGVSGISTIVYELYQFNPAFVQWMINIPLFFLGLILLGKDFGMKSLLGTFFVPLVIWISADLPFAIDNPLLAAIYGGSMIGVGLGIVYRGRGSTGGLSTLGQIVKKYSGLSSGYAQFIVDGCVVVTSAVVFGLEIALFAMISIFVMSKVIDLVQLQASPSKLVLIITEREAQIQTIIREEIDRGLTKVRSVGGYTNDEKTMILCVMEQQEAVYLKRVLQNQEPSSFVIFLNASEIIGRGFSFSKFYGAEK